MTILFTIDTNTNQVFGYDDNPGQQALAQQRISSGHVDCGRAPVQGETWQNGSWVQTLSSQQISNNQISIITTSLSSQIQSTLDTGAQKWGYDTMDRALTYLNSSNTKFANDAKALLTWRDSVWTWALSEFATVTPTSNTAAILVNIPQQPTQPV